MFMPSVCHNFLSEHLPVVEWQFTSYGLDVIDLMEDDPVGRTDPMARIFPKVTKCSIRK